MAAIAAAASGVSTGLDEFSNILDPLAFANHTLLMQLQTLPVVGRVAHFLPQILPLLMISLIPVFIGLLQSRQARILAWFSKKCAQWRHEHIRVIEHTASSDYYANLRADHRNNILQKATTLHISNTKHSFPQGSISLTEPTEEEESWSDKTSLARSAKTLRKLKITTMPSENVWEVVADGVEIMHSQEDVPADLYERSTLFRHTFRSNRRDGSERIDKFLTQCLKEYTELLRRQEDKARYMYQMQLGLSIKSEADAAKPPVFKKYKLSEDKTFDSLFFPSKADTLRLVDDFVEKREKFAIDGFPQKLGLLLHGPPGTGKTSFVKALATYTKRHIVSVPLSKITTNQELYDIMFERVFRCLGDDGVPQQFEFKEIIFLMEDVDAASDIVKSRKTRPCQESTLRKEESVMFQIDEAAGGGAPAPQSTTKRATIAVEDPLQDDTKDSIAPSVGLSGWDTLLAPLKEPVADKLDLAGLLNVLDGVVDSPGRIVIMTTNHPEKLDAALIRPGRINTKLLFTFMQEPEMKEMLAHHYGNELTSKKEVLLHEILEAKHQHELDEGNEEGFCITPAEVEQLCAEADTLDDFFKALRAFPEFGPAYDY